uniref:Ras-associating domain-containing protein n=1 Tax=Sparus aurata TaxID=8175 RepID=A0A671Y1M8_SPAAU
MEVKVSVDGIPRVVCGVTEETTCQEVVIALAQALGQPGRYTLRETFKDFERCMTPNERLLETLEKYGEQAREVQLMLLHNGPSGWDEMSRTKVEKMQKSLKSDLDQQTSCCMGSPARGKESKHGKKTQEAKLDDLSSSCCATTEDEKNSLRETIIFQLGCLQDLQAQIAHIDKQIFELEEKQRAKKSVQEAQQRMAEEEMEQIKFWENELKAEEGYEKDLHGQFLEMRAKAVECKHKLEDYRHKMQGLDFFASQNVAQEDSETTSKVGASATATGTWRQSDPDRDVNINRKSLPREGLQPPDALVPPGQIKERRPTGPTELREWWSRWSQAQGSQTQTKQKVIHRSELTIYLGSTKV